MADKMNLLNQIRYAQRLCERTARLYRRLQTAGTFASIVGGSAAAAGLAQLAPSWVGLLGGGVLALFVGALLAIRPADKAAANEADVRRYARLASDGLTMDADALEVALSKAKEGNAPELEPLRQVAYNDIVMEMGREDQAFKLTLPQRILSALA